MKQCSVSIGKRVPKRRGFTLVEMLVSVGLVLLMMTMFASIFQMATDSVGKQRSVSENDQKARLLFNIIRSDIQHRTFRYPLPFYPGEDSATSATRFGNRGGYIYISTNDPLSGLDDILQLTVDANITSENGDTTPFVGRAARLKDPSGYPGYFGPNDPRRSNVLLSPNQPDADDSSIELNETSNSNAAEVVYFVRGGNLYRRMVLLRKPLGVAGGELGRQPKADVSGHELMLPTFDPDAIGGFALANGTFSNDYWANFDHSAIPISGPQRAQLLGTKSLNNELVTSGATNEAVGNPAFRFGFNSRRIADGMQGASREHSDLTGSRFLGRFTHAETSARNFNWPQSISVTEFDPSSTIPTFEPAQVALFSSQTLPASSDPGNPLDVQNRLNLIGDDQIVAEFDNSVGVGLGRGGPRRMEDLLLTGVQELKIEIWDDRLNRFVTPGHSETDLNPPPGFPGEGDYHISRSLNRFAGPFGSHANGVNLNRTFDTWHPKVTIDLNADGNPDLDPPPPFIAYDFYPPVAPTGPSPASLTGPFGEYWQPNQSYPPSGHPPGVPFVVFVPWIDQGGMDGVFQYNEIARPRFHIAYELIVPGNSGLTAPSFPSTPGLVVQDGSCQWRSFDNRRPLQAIRMTVRFMDQKSQSVRQLSLILPLLEQKKS